MTDTAGWTNLLETAKAQCPVGLWSRGVAWAREGAVSGESRDEQAWTFRVRCPGQAVAPTVSLYPADAEWECDCDAAFDACDHVAAAAAAVVAAVQTDQGPALLFAVVATGGLRYELHGDNKGLTLQRFFVGDGDPEPVLAPLADRRGVPRTDVPQPPTHADLKLDRLVTYLGSGPFGFEEGLSLLRALVGVDDLVLDGQPVRASADPLYPCATVTDFDGVPPHARPKGSPAGAPDHAAIQLTIRADPGLERVVSPGIALADGTLRPFGAAQRFGERWERLPFHRVFQGPQLAELVGTVLPELDRHIVVDVRTQRLPAQRGDAEPWIRFELEFVDAGVAVQPLLVYGDPAVVRIDGGRMVHLQGAIPKRQERREKELIWELRDELNLVPGRRVEFATADAAKFLSQMDTFTAAHMGPDGLAGGRSGGRRLIMPCLDAADDGFSLAFETDDDGPTATADADDVVSAWQQGISVVPLSDGGFAALPADWLDRHGHLVADLLSARQHNQGDIPRAALPLVGELCEVLDAPEPFELTRLRPLLDSTEETTQAQAAVICPDLHGTLRPYQAVGVGWLHALRRAGLGAVLADDMGLGKTIQALCVVGSNTLVVCPRSVIHNWTHETARFRPDLDVALYHGPRRELTHADITLTTYATLRNDAELLSQHRWDTVVLDEAQNIKNPDSKVAQAAYGLQSTFFLSLSGTPVENRLDELWSQLHFTNRGLLGGRRDFAERYEKPIAAGDTDTAERLRTRIRPFVLRRLKREVATDLPPRTEAILHCELDDHERALYEAIRMAARSDVARQLAEGGSVMAALEALLRLRQAACHSGLLPDREAPTSSKVQALCEALDDAAADGHKALVFSQWTALLDRIEPHLQHHQVGYTRLDGKTRDRETVVRNFQDADGPPVLLLSLKAGGTGLNLTAADHVFLMDPWWNPATEDQAADRAHRIGQDRPVMVYRMVAKDTVEERILELQEHKRRIAEAALGQSNAGGAAAITREDILALLE